MCHVGGDFKGRLDQSPVGLVARHGNILESGDASKLNISANQTGVILGQNNQKTPQEGHPSNPSSIYPETPRRSSLGICHPSPTQVKVTAYVVTATRYVYNVMHVYDTYYCFIPTCLSRGRFLESRLEMQHPVNMNHFSLVNASQYSPRFGHGRQGVHKEPSLEAEGYAEEGCDNAISNELHQSSTWKSGNDMSRNQCLVKKVS